MKYTKNFNLLILITTFFLLIISTSYSLGITIPSQSKFYFTPNMEFNIPFRILNNGNPQFINVNIDGDLKNYSSVTETRFWIETQSSHAINLIAKLPSNLEPGSHAVSIIATEVGDSSKDQNNGVTARTAVRHTIQVFVPYPNNYVTVRTKLSEIELNQKCQIPANIQNLGNNDNNVLFNLEILDENNNIILQKQPTPSSIYMIKSTDKDISLDIEECRDLNIGIYKVKTNYEFAGIKKSSESELRIGSFDVILLNYSKLIEAGKINKFTIKLKSIWNSVIKNIHFKLIIYNGTKEITNSEIAPFDMTGWKVVEKNIFIDAPSNEGNYNAKIELYYDTPKGQKKITKDVSIEVKKEKFNLIGYAIFSKGSIISIGLAIIIILSIYFIYRKYNGNTEIKSLKKIKPKSKK